MEIKSGQRRGDIGSVPGESRNSLQGSNICLHLPSVTVTSTLPSKKNHSAQNRSVHTHTNTDVPALSPTMKSELLVHDFRSFSFIITPQYTSTLLSQHLNANYQESPQDTTSLLWHLVLVQTLFLFLG